MPTVTLNATQADTMSSMVRFKDSYKYGDRRVLQGLVNLGLITGDLSDTTPLGEQVRLVVRENFRHVPRPADPRIVHGKNGTIQITVED